MPMHTILNHLTMAVALSGLLAAQASAADMVSEKRPVEAKVVRIALDGIVSLKVRQGATASLTVSGERDSIAKIMTTQTGDTLRIGTDYQSSLWDGKPRPQLQAELSLPALVEVASSGVGASEVSGFAGETLKVSLSGAGQMKVAGGYKHVIASLSGVGQLSIEARDADSVELALPGTGSVVASGQTKSLTAQLSGAGSVNAKELSATSANVMLSGVGSATVNVSHDINLSMSGLGSATVYGQPLQRKVDKSGLGRVTYQ
jgi:hypothetical protein